MVVLLFPGQGSQKVGMGRELAEQFPQARDVFDAADRALGFELSRLMWEGPEDELTLTHNAQPAILTHSLAAYSLVRDRIAPQLAAGHSLGEYSAYAAAGALSLEDAVRLVRRRGELMLEAGEQRPGAMAAVLGLPSDQVAQACSRACHDGEVAVPANMNAPDQTVISGDPRAVERAGEECKQAGAKRVLPLKVSGAFHSPLMEPARQGLARALGEVEFRDPAFPVIANATGEKVERADDAMRLLADQLVHPVRWVATMQLADELAPDGARFIEVGPGAVLSGLLKRCVQGRRAETLGTAEEVEQFQAQA